MKPATPPAKAQRWFAAGTRFFVAGAAVAALSVVLLWLPQMRVLAAVALVQALLGVGVCLWGLRTTQTPAPIARPRSKGRWHVRRLMHMITGHARSPFMS